MIYTSPESNALVKTTTNKVSHTESLFHNALTSMVLCSIVNTLKDHGKRKFDVNIT